MAGGDARRALNALELAVESTDPGAGGVIRVDLAAARECMPRRDLMYDRAGEAHYDTVSAFIKSVRGSDVDAALYWLARMLEAGEDPRFIMRRLLILASEDIGLADPQALVQAAAASQALDLGGPAGGAVPPGPGHHVSGPGPQEQLHPGLLPGQGGPGGQRRHPGAGPLQDAHRDKKGLGHGQGYLYPHDFPGHWVDQAYLPAELRGASFYEPGTEGEEPELAARWRARAEPGKKSGSPGSQSGEDP